MLSEHIKQAVESKGIALMGHIVCGYPSFEANWEILTELDKAGVDIVEMQFPFSEPIADGPLFLYANQESLKQGTKIKDCFELMRKASKEFSFKILMMGYYNTVFKTGEEKFCQLLSEAGGCGMIIPDLPVEESKSLRNFCSSRGIVIIPLVAPTSTNERIQEIVRDAGGFVYAVARKGVTGAKTEFSDDLSDYIKRIRKYTDIPVAVGFGIAEKSDIDHLRGKADVAVMGTAILKSYLDKGRDGVSDLMKALEI